MKQKAFNKLADECGFFIAQDNKEVTMREVQHLLEYVVSDIVAMLELNTPKHLITTHDLNQHKATLEHYFKLLDERYA